VARLLTGVCEQLEVFQPEPPEGRGVIHFEGGEKLRRATQRWSA
jgi:hypothetical protein